MFKLDDISDTYEYPVKFTVVDGKGRQQSHTITMLFKRLERDEMVDKIKSEDRQQTITGAELVSADLDYLLGFCDGWKGVEINGDTEFNRENLEKLLLKVPQIALEISSAFLESANGGRQRKN